MRIGDILRKRKFRRKSCSGKKRYYSSADASAMAKLQRDKYGVHVHAYLCDFCGHWHLGH